MVKQKKTNYKLSSGKLSSNKYTSSDLCQILLSAGVISKDQAKEVLKREKTIIRTIKKEREKKNGSAIDITFVDVILYLKLKRADQPSKRLDED
ncbi:MAG: hypothetical protein GY707_00160, partial [Desulfobacteraceae bacterium]|nr:hypothetical protein [Desulfobacteraceae bacterium]